MHISTLVERETNPSTRVQFTASLCSCILSYSRITLNYIQLWALYCWIKYDSNANAFQPNDFIISFSAHMILSFVTSSTLFLLMLCTAAKFCLTVKSTCLQYCCVFRFSCVLWLKEFFFLRFALSQNTSQKIQSVTHKFTDAYKFHSMAVAKPDLIHHRIESNFRMFFQAIFINVCINMPKPNFIPTSIPFNQFRLKLWRSFRDTQIYFSFFNSCICHKYSHIWLRIQINLYYASGFSVSSDAHAIIFLSRFERFFSVLIRKESAKLLCEIPRIEGIFCRIVDIFNFRIEYIIQNKWNIRSKWNNNNIWNKWNNETFGAYGNEQKNRKQRKKTSKQKNICGSFVRIKISLIF